MLREYSPQPSVTCHMLHVTCHESVVTCQVSHVRCHVSGVRCEDKVVELGRGGSVINGAYPVWFHPILAQYTSDYD